jgi:hypothetical protein
MQRSKFVQVSAKFYEILSINSEIIARDRTGIHTRIKPRYSQPHVHNRVTRAVISRMSAVVIVTSYKENLEYDKHKRRGKAHIL